MVGIGETRFGVPRWMRHPADGEVAAVRSVADRFVDLAGGQDLLGQMIGRTCVAVVAWLQERDEAWRYAIELVAIDPGLRSISYCRPW